MKKIAIIGGGPAALMLAAKLDAGKYEVNLYEKKKTVGRKFLVAGEGGLNLTYDEPLPEFIANYAPPEFMGPIISKFTNVDLRDWLGTLGVPTYAGSSHRVFPAPELKPFEVLNKITDHCTSKGVRIHTSTEWTGWDVRKQPTFNDVKTGNFDVVVFALGGASWKVTGSDGAWSRPFREGGFRVLPFRAANCAFAVGWARNFIGTHAGKPLKNIAVNYRGHVAKGELVISGFGIEGNAIYALSHAIQQTLATEKSTVVHLDLKPTMTVEQIRAKYRNSKRPKVTDILKTDLNLDRTAVGLLKQFTDKDTFLDPDSLCATIKAIPLTVYAADDLDKAISSTGGLSLDEIDANFECRNLPGTFVIGEMLDWFAPTGGYLLQGCFSMGAALAQHLNGLYHGNE